MGEDYRCSIIDMLGSSKGYDIALMTTFNYEIDFFERAILSSLLSKEIRTISVFVDANELTKALNNHKNLGIYMGRKYMVNPIRMNASFHPKVFLLLGEKKARLFVGSSNITFAGCEKNNEAFSYVDYDENHSEYLDVIVDAINFFSDINDVSYGLDSQVIKYAKNYIYYHKSKKNNEIRFIHNLENTILSQVHALIEGEVKKIYVAVPYYDRELMALKRIKEVFPETVIDLYIQNKKSTFPLNYDNNNHLFNSKRVFSGFKDAVSVMSNNFYHGKVFLFKTSSKAYILYGSANCTMSALTKSYKEGGNIECDLIEVGKTDEFDYFFDNMNFEVDEEFTSQEMVFESLGKSNYIFKYGELRDRIALHIDYVKKDTDVIVKYNNTELKYEYIENEMIIYINEELVDTINGIFDISFYYDDIIEEMRCWTYSYADLVVNREKRNKSDSFNNIDIDALGEKYAENIQRILEAEITCYADLQEHNSKLQYLEQIKIEQDEGIEDSDEIFVEYQIPDEYRYYDRKVKELSKIRNKFYRKFLTPSFLKNPSPKKSEKKESVNDGEEKINAVDRRESTNSEKSFAQFVRRRIKGMMNEAYIEGIEIRHFVALVSVYFDIFNEYKNVSDLFSDEYVVEKKLALMRLIINKATNDSVDDEELIKAIIWNTIIVIFENYQYYKRLKNEDERYRYKAYNKDIILLLENAYSIRKDCSKYISDVLNEAELMSSYISYDEACKYIEDLYGYMTFDKLNQLIEKTYPDSYVDMNNKKLKIAISTDNISLYKRPDINLIREINKYSRNAERIDTIQIDINNSANLPSYKNYLVSKRFTISLDYRRLKWIETRVRGDIERGSEYFNF